MASLQEEIDGFADRLRPHYARFLDGRGEEVLLTGHSHQAWPDAAREGQIAAWDDAARLVDKKWERVLSEILPELQAQVAKRIGSTRAEDIAVGQSTHELVYRFSSCFDRAPCVLSTDSEFHSLERQLDRMSEDGTRVIRVPVEDAQHGGAGGFAHRFIAEARAQRPTWAALSMVFFTTSQVIVDLDAILAELARLRIPVIVDAYHAFNAIEVFADRFAGDAYVVGGGYKYAECGEGACWMLLPRSAVNMRPRYTGWFSHFEGLKTDRGLKKHAVEYGAGGLRFSGSTFDPTGIYRAVHVFRFMDKMGLDVRTLRAQSERQTQMIIDGLDSRNAVKRLLRLATPREARARGGFVALRSADAPKIQAALEDRGIRTDVRGDLLRLGPAPYTTSGEIARALDVLETVAADLS
jgi:kynureninase